jgi:elongator complex protein 3
LAEQRAEEKGIEPRDIRAREVGMNDADPDPERVELRVREYEACGGTEHFIAFEDPVADLLIGFCRLRFPNDPVRRELEDAAVVRELHVYGSEAGIGTTDGDWQHKGYGTRLLARAEELAREAGYRKLSVISGIGVRQYYREKLGYHQDGPYVSKRLD